MTSQIFTFTTSSLIVKQQKTEALLTNVTFDSILIILNIFDFYYSILPVIHWFGKDKDKCTSDFKTFLFEYDVLNIHNVLINRETPKFKAVIDQCDF